LPTFFDELADPFYSTCSKAIESFQLGHIFLAPAYYPHQQLEIWRPEILDARLGTASNFKIISAGQNAFRRDAPYNSPALASNEEFIALKAKKRPVVLIKPPDPKLQAIKRGPHSGKIVRHLGPVALAYSAENESGFAKFPKSFVEDTRLLKYPQFFFLPKGGPIQRDSLLRFDELQSIAMNNLEPTEWSLSTDVVGVLSSQLSFFLTGQASEQYLEWRTELQK
jgi:hypothetical protein